jgi:hypothetical protein
MNHIRHLIARVLRLLISPSGVLELTKVAGTFVLALIFCVSSASAAPIILQNTGLFCDVRSVNDVGFGVGRFVTLTAT